MRGTGNVVARDLRPVTASTQERPFVFIESTIDLPFPPSVNKTRKIDWAGRQAHEAWLHMADRLYLYQKRACTKIPGAFEAIITLAEDCAFIDLDNGIKNLIDVAKRFDLIVDDNRKYFRKLTVQWGAAPEGCRLTLRSWEAA